MAPDRKLVRISDFMQYSVAKREGSDVLIGLLYRNDLQGSFPTWLVNWFSTVGLPMYLKQIEDACKARTETMRLQAQQAAPAA
mmetsp:Transcript_9291/g.14663  ORF Transcript_9291/g.14663 Transcript_9291/m.14663 type:complete len:83 (+) Transcript_9291:275-523(+)